MHRPSLVRTPYILQRPYFPTLVLFCWLSVHEIPLPEQQTVRQRPISTMYIGMWWETYSNIAMIVHLRLSDTWNDNERGP